MGVPTLIYHKDYEPMIVDSDELKKFYKKGWVDSPAKIEQEEEEKPEEAVEK